MAGTGIAGAGRLEPAARVCPDQAVTVLALVDGGHKTAKLQSFTTMFSLDSNSVKIK